MALTEKLVFCLLSNVAVALGTNIISQMEMKRESFLYKINFDDDPRKKRHVVWGCHWSGWDSG